jgi:predicted nucleic acid-binding protein
VISPPWHLREAAESLAVAREYGLSVYDAPYLARRSDLPLATIDPRLEAAARKSGITITFGAAKVDGSSAQG